jgi:hypothetical protein
METDEALAMRHIQSFTFVLKPSLHLNQFTHPFNNCSLKQVSLHSKSLHHDLSKQITKATLLRARKIKLEFDQISVVKVKGHGTSYPSEATLTSRSEHRSNYPERPAAKREKIKVFQHQTHSRPMNKKQIAVRIRMWERKRVIQ